MDLELHNKVALITGGAKGIGAATVRQFVMEGARVFFVDKDREAAAALLEETRSNGMAPVFLEADLTDSASCRDVVGSVMKEAGRVDALINNAGINDAVGLDQTVEAFRESLRRNLDHVFGFAHGLWLWPRLLFV